jgi:hypothetical protein
MNEKIAELAISSYVTVGDYSYCESVLDPEKFAKLIIQECLDIVTATSNESADFGRTVLENSAWINFDINRYFGIE